jgi:hypothetical protein
MVGLHPPNSNPYGYSYEGHIIKDWKRILQIPKKQNPMEDSTGGFCMGGQNISRDKLLYLSCNTGEVQNRSIDVQIPPGSGVYIAINPVVVTEDEAKSNNENDLSKFAKDDIDSTSKLSLEINGKKYNSKDLEPYRFRTRPFEVDLSPDALWGRATLNHCKAVADGHYVITEPLPPGPCKIVTEAEVSKPFNHQGTWSSKVSYAFDVR